ncbi:MAG: hypothetical protein F4Y38_09995 [Gemmatimonadetes bacterium]|nr:hypothetical protein [Gemmatimonadota bacterium]MYG85677.1 hypothetical protein [Gemmatimonadota bacterium]MYJ90165.1 hypothetical protein [Gemmatimonadota bacterium]
MRRKHNLRLARVIQCISGVLAVLTIYPLVRLIYPCCRRLKGTGNHGESGGRGDDRKSGGRHASGLHSPGSSEPPGGPSGKSIAQDK